MADEKAEAQKKLEFLQQEYWRMRNGKQSFIRCPYCRPFKKTFRSNLKANHEGEACCQTFVRAFKAILDRQEQVDIAAKSARDTVRLGNLMAQQNGNRLVN